MASTRPSGYSGTPLPTKLGITPGARVGVLSAPLDFVKRLRGIPVVTRLGGAPFDEVWSGLRLVIRKSLR